MKATGIVRRIDDLGRIVVPKEIRRTLRIREGDPLEIYTGREGEIMLKKYSPIGEIGEFATAYAQALAQVSNALICITDREYVIAAAGIGHKGLEGEHLSTETEDLMEKRGTFTVTNMPEELPVLRNKLLEEFKVAVLSTIICNGDCQGAVMILGKNTENPQIEIWKVLAQSAAAFMGKHMEQ